ncbi:LPS-assembly protein LptD [invertebrate metagenome]|uniref:LPS-assembly protein LptD n=1 Tax=invertebrate metagenome TaxID=1711999 RepID=A0A2H9T663_9ZZZZ
MDIHRFLLRFGITSLTAGILAVSGFTFVYGDVLPEGEVSPEKTQQKQTPLTCQPFDDGQSCGEVKENNKKQVLLSQSLDWVPFSQLTDLQKRSELPYSCGAYIEPRREGLEFSVNPEDAPIVAESDESTYQDESLATFTGNVLVRKGSRQLQSDRVTFDKLKNYATFEGNVVYREKGVLLTSDKGAAQVDSGWATMDNLHYVLHDARVRGEAGSMVRNEDTSLDLANAMYTSCPPGDGGWRLQAEKVNLDPVTGFGSARNTTIWVEGIPVLYTPYLYFPIDDRRQTGFLYPSFSFSSDNGTSLSLPYYWNLAPNYDVTITPNYMSKRGLLLENEFRYLTEKQKGELGIAGLSGDKLRDENPYYNENRWLLNWRHSLQMTPRWNMDIDYANASDKDYFRDFGSQLGVTSEGPLNQTIATHYMGRDEAYDWQFSLAANQYKNMSRTDDDPYNQLPHMELKGQWLASEFLNIGYVADYSRFERADDWNYVREVDDDRFDPKYNVKRSIYDDGYGLSKAEGQRAYAETGISYDMRSSYGFIKPAAKIRHVQYRLDNLEKDEVIKDLSYAYRSSFKANDYTETPSTTVPVVSLDSGLYLERQLSLGGSSFTHTFEPRAKYLYVPYVKGQEMNPIFDTAELDFSYESLWRDNRFTGYDRLGDANQLSLGFSSRLLGDNGVEKLRFGIGQTVYFQDRKVYIDPYQGSEKEHMDDEDVDLEAQRKRLHEELEAPVSPLAAELVYTINRSANLRQDVSWNTDRNRLDNYGFYFRYHSDQDYRKVLNMGYRYRNQTDRFEKDDDGDHIHDPTDPTGFKTTSNNLSLGDVSFAWPVTRNWSALGRWQYDLTNNRNFEVMSGMEYNSCCYQVRLLWRSWTDPDDNLDHPSRKRGVFLQFVLRGLGGLGSGSADDYLSGIQGYTQREK